MDISITYIQGKNGSGDKDLNDVSDDEYDTLDMMDSLSTAGNYSAGQFLITILMLFT